MLVKDKVVVITGASAGVGLATAGQLAELGAQVAIVCRDPARGEPACQRIAARGSGEKPALFLADLSLQADIRALAAKIRSRFPRIDVLINNAGAMFARRELTVDGIEKTFAINHLAPFLLTNLLLDAVAPGGRIVIVTSESHSGSLDFENLQGERTYNFFAAYNRSKLGNILFANELARRTAGSVITVNSTSPGPTRTTFGDGMQGLPGLFPRFMKRIPFLMATPEEGARTPVYVASSPELDGVSGRFFLRLRERRSKPITYDPEVAARLWSVSARLCGM
ncbi:MAG TPA: SDR family oxidoreductase [Thermoanaerobaculia bacterium]|nr:SDR family oxidoreductase [Thermoanaerobaculia bacterium]